VNIPEDDPSMILSPLAMAANKSENLDIFKTIYNDPRVGELKKLDDKVFMAAAHNLKNNTIFAILMNDKRVSIENINAGLLYCIVNNNTEAFMMLTLYKYYNTAGLYVGVNLGDNNNVLITNACAYDNVEIVKYLLNNINVDPTVQQDNPLFHAVDRGYVEVVKLLLNDPRVNPSNNNNVAIKLAIQKYDETWGVNYSKIMNMIRSHPRYIPLPVRILGFNFNI
jgi:hypothetical protein